MLCCAVLRCAVLCLHMLCSAVLCCADMCCAALTYLCYADICCAVPLHDMPCFAMSCHALPCHAGQWSLTVKKSGRCRRGGEGTGGAKAAAQRKAFRAASDLGGTAKPGRNKRLPRHSLSPPKAAKHQASCIQDEPCFATVCVS